MRNHDDRFLSHTHRSVEILRDKQYASIIRLTLFQSYRKPPATKSFKAVFLICFDITRSRDHYLMRVLRVLSLWIVHEDENTHHLPSRAFYKGADQRPICSLFLCPIEMVCEKYLQ